MLSVRLRSSVLTYFTVVRCGLEYARIISCVSPTDVSWLCVGYVGCGGRVLSCWRRCCGRLWAPSPETEVPTLSSQPIAALVRRLARMPETQEFTDIEAHNQTHTHIAGPYDVDGG